MEFLAVCNAAVKAQPVIQDSGINLSEIRMELQSALVEIGQARVGAGEAGFYLSTDNKNGNSRSMSGSTTAILLERAAKLGKRHQ